MAENPSKASESTTDIFIRLLRAKSTLQERLTWNRDNPDFRCSQCTENLQHTCTPHSDRGIRCSFCQQLKRYCSRVFAERRARVQRLMNLDDEQFEELEKEAKEAGIRVKVNTYSKPANNDKAVPAVLSDTTYAPGPSARPNSSASANASASAPVRLSQRISKKTPKAANPKIIRKVVVEVERPAERNNTVTDRNMATKLKKTEEELERTREELDQTQKELKKAKECIRKQELEQANTIRRNIAEHTNLNVLKTRLRRAVDGLDDRNISRQDMIDACRNLCEQLQDIADRHLDNVPVGFSDIMDAMVVDSEDENGDSDIQRPAQKRRRR